MRKYSLMRPVLHAAAIVCRRAARPRLVWWVARAVRNCPIQAYCNKNR